MCQVSFQILGTQQRTEQTCLLTAYVLVAGRQVNGICCENYCEMRKRVAEMGGCGVGQVEAYTG